MDQIAALKAALSSKDAEIEALREELARKDRSVSAMIGEILELNGAYFLNGHKKVEEVAMRYAYNVQLTPKDEDGN